MKGKRLIFLGAFLLVSCLAFFPTAGITAQQPTPSDDQVNAIARQMYCPICENIPLDVCPTQACHDWRELIRQMLADGKTPAQIKQYFVDHYGARVLAEPPARVGMWFQFRLPLLILLLALLLVGGIFFYHALQAGKKKLQPDGNTTPPQVASTGMDDYASRFEEELRRRS